MPSGAKGSNRNYTVYGKFKSPGASLHWSRKQGNIMPKNQGSKNIEQLLAEADDLIQLIRHKVITGKNITI
jgi:hypothetical protein